MIGRPAGLAAAALVVAAACAADAPDGSGDVSDDGADDGGACAVGRASAALGLPDRAIVGPADLYPADGSLRGREEELRGSQLARRQAAWSVVERALAPVALAEDLPADLPAEVPRFQTWYGHDDFQRMFHRLYLDLGPDGRRERTPLGDAAIDDALGWNAEAVHEASSWPADRFQAYLAAIDEEAEVGGIGGIGRVAYSPGAIRHLLGSYARTLPCVYGDAPPAFGEGAAPPVRALTRQAVDLGACERRELGPFFVASGEDLRATVDDGAPASLRLLAGPPEAREEVCAAAPGEPCQAPGPGPFTVEVAAGETGGRAVVAVELGEAQPTWAACMAGPFPLDAAVVKADWRRIDFGAELPVHDTSAEALARRLAGDQDWGEGEETADPGPEDIYTVKLPGGDSYRLAALHIMTKELDHWMWATLWWSPEPDSDFGADRPDSVAELGGPWSHYKMCTAAWFREEDPDPTGGAAAPSLAAALSATHAGPGGPSWCSNPYLEIGHGNSATNCAGCHQHGGTGLAPEVILDDPRFPERGRLQVRNNFATDYSWAVESGDRLGRVIADEVEYYDSYE
jgi:hypothetical protein